MAEEEAWAALWGSKAEDRDGADALELEPQKGTARVSAMPGNACPVLRGLYHKGHRSMIDFCGANNSDGWKETQGAIRGHKGAQEERQMEVWVTARKQP